MNITEKRKRFSSQLTKYFGNKQRVKELIEECKSVGLDLGDVEVIDKIAEYPEWFQVIISYSELGLLRRLGSAVNILHGLEKIK